uniref:Uncharacterized protein n=1 Tax=Panagrellus redivivus TaxID=6233 RepID=A0A7E4W256_PANRE
MEERSDVDPGVFELNGPRAPPIIMSARFIVVLSKPFYPLGQSPPSSFIAKPLTSLQLKAINASTKPNHEGYTSRDEILGDRQEVKSRKHVLGC